jgi:hypothetical protein
VERGNVEHTKFSHLYLAHVVDAHSVSTTYYATRALVTGAY